MGACHKIKERLKKSDLVRNTYTKADSLLTAILVKCAPVIASKYLYKRNTGKRLNLKSPNDFNEKLQWLKLYWQHPLVTKCGDKYKVRQYVKENGYAEKLNELYGDYEDAQ